MLVQINSEVNRIPLDDISLVLVTTTQAVITTALIAELSNRQVKVIFSDQTRQPVCETMGYYPNNRNAELLQTQLNWSDRQKELLWTKIVAEKIKNQIKVLQNYGRETAELQKELLKLEINDISNREAVVARKYFELLFDEKFTRRDYSATNAALNYGYSILLSTIDREIVKNGYLTYWGIHHHSEENQFNLGSDLMEPFRPIIDYWVADQKFKELTPDIKIGLVDLLNLEIRYNGKIMLLQNAISQYVRDCLHYLIDEKMEFIIEVNFNDEVPNNALNGFV